MAGTLTKKFKKLLNSGDDKEKRSPSLQIDKPTGVKHNPLPPEMLKIIMNAKEQNDEEAKKQLENVYEYFHEQQNKQTTGKTDFMKYQHKSANIRGTSSEDSLDEGTFIYQYLPYLIQWNLRIVKKGETWQPLISKLDFQQVVCT